MVKGAGRKSCFLVFTRVLGDIFSYFVNYVNLRNKKMQIRGKTRRFLFPKVRPVKLGVMGVYAAVWRHGGKRVKAA